MEMSCNGYWGGGGGVAREVEVMKYISHEDVKWIEIQQTPNSPGPDYTDCRLIRCSVWEIDCVSNVKLHVNLVFKKGTSTK
jgi:hypothetical protein